MVMVPIGTPEPVGAVGAYWSVAGAPPADAAAMLEVLARASATVLENGRLVETLATGEERLRETLRTLDLASVMARDLDGTIRFWSAGCERLYGWTAAEAVGRSAHDLLRTAFLVPRGEVEAALRRDGTWRGDLRQCRRDGSELVVAAHKALRRGPTGRPVAVAESLTDVTELRRVEERQALLMREPDHRAKNALAVVQAALRLTKDDPEAFARAVEGRVAALARAHTILAQGRWEGAALSALVEAEMAAFLTRGEGTIGGDDAGALASPPPPRITADGPALALAPGAAQGLSMALHELATNATKYGALCASDGRVAVARSVDRGAGVLRLRWEERGGPEVQAPPSRRGFGSRVLEATVRDQLGGRLERRWERTGLICEMAFPLGRILSAAARTPRLDDPPPSP
jgi:PAS domain S-box-containing protein